MANHEVSATNPAVGALFITLKDIQDYYDKNRGDNPPITFTEDEARLFAQTAVSNADVDVFLDEYRSGPFAEITPEGSP